MKRVKLFLKIILFALVILFGSIWLTTYILKDEIEQRITQIIYKSVDSEITIKKTQLSFWKSFPTTSLELENLMCKGSTNNDTLVFLESVFLKINPWKLIRKKIEITQLSLQKGVVNLIKNKEHKNYNVWTKDSTTKEKGVFDIKKIKIQDVGVKYSNHSLDLIMESKIGNQEVYFLGDIISFETNAHILTGVYKGAFLDNTDIELLGEIKIDKEKLKSAKAIFNINGLPVNIEYLTKEKAHIAKFITKNIRITKLLEEISPFLETKKWDVNFSGELTSETILAISEKDTILTSVFVAKDINAQKENIKIESLNCSGKLITQSLLTPQNYVLKIDTLWSNSNKNFIQGKGDIKNLKNPEIKVLIDASFPGEVLNEIFPNDIKITEGNVTTSLSLDSKQKKTEGTYTLKGIALGQKELENVVRIQTAEGEIKNDVNTFKTTLVIGKDTILFSGDLSNIHSLWPTETTDLTLNAQCKGKSLNISELVKKQKENTSLLDFSIKIPKRITVYLKTNIESIKHNRLEFNNTDGTIKIKENRISCLNCKFLSMGGNAVTDFVLEDNGRNLDLRISAELNKINIKKLFFDFHEFGQDYITSLNLKGEGSTKGTFSAQFDREFNIIPTKVKLSAEVEIESGELIEFEPLKHLSRFVSLEDLEHIYFATLENHVKIKNKIIEIPYMNVKSSALDLKMEGTHTFENRVDYNFSILLSEILFKKKKKEKLFLENITISKETKGPSLHLSMKGEATDPEIKFNKIALKETIKTDLKKPTKKEEPNIIFEWDDQ